MNFTVLDNFFRMSMQNPLQHFFTFIPSLVELLSTEEKDTSSFVKKTRIFLMKKVHCTDQLGDGGKREVSVISIWC